MIRRDYILGMIEDFARALAKLRALRAGEKWEEADALVLEAFKKLIGDDGQKALTLSETEILALIVREGPTIATGHKAMLLATLLVETAEAVEAQRGGERALPLRIKALNLMLAVGDLGNISDWPQFVPTIDRLASDLASETLPPRTTAALMAHFERAGEFAKAEDALFSLLDGDPQNRAMIEFGRAFYRRLLTLDDDALAAGNLPRNEVEESLRELERPRVS